jgi:hypothetical protein
VVLVALSALLDSHQPGATPSESVANAIGRAVEQEVRAQRVEANRSAALATFAACAASGARHGQPEGAPGTAARSQQPGNQPNGDEVGLLLLELISTSTSLW